jgi:hypothetical protein
MKDDALALQDTRRDHAPSMKNLRTEKSGRQVSSESFWPSAQVKDQMLDKTGINLYVVGTSRMPSFQVASLSIVRHSEPATTRCARAC